MFGAIFYVYKKEVQKMSDCLSCKWLFVIDPYLVIGILYIYLGLEKMLRYLFFVFIEKYEMRAYKNE